MCVPGPGFSLLLSPCWRALKRSVNRGFQLWFEIPDETEVELRLERGSKEAKLRYKGGLIEVKSGWGKMTSRQNSNHRIHRLHTLGASAHGKNTLSRLVTQHCDPALSRYREKLYLSHLRFLGIAGYRAIPPLLGVSQKCVEGGGVNGAVLGGGIASQCCPLRYRAL